MNIIRKFILKLKLKFIKIKPRKSNNRSFVYEEDL